MVQPCSRLKRKQDNKNINMDQASSGDTGSSNKVATDIEINKRLPFDLVSQGMTSAGDGKHNSRIKVLASEDINAEQEVFLDSSTVDFLLEKSSGLPSISLSRVSLYAKFDPLVGSRVPGEIREKIITMREENEETNALGADVCDASHSSGPRVLGEDTNSLQNIDKHTCENIRSVHVRDEMVITHDLVIIEEDKPLEQETEVVSPKTNMVSNTDTKSPAPNSDMTSPERCNDMNKSLETQEDAKPCKHNAERKSVGKSAEAQEDNAVISEGMRNSLLGDDTPVQEEASLLREILVKQEVAYREDLNYYQKQVNSLKAALKESQEKHAALRGHVAASCEESLQAVMAEYEQTIQDLIRDKEALQNDFDEQHSALIVEYQIAKDHLHSLESAFGDLHRKYEKTKDDCFRSCSHIKSQEAAIRILEEALLAERENFEQLKSHASEILENANREFTEKETFHQTELERQKAILKKSELQIHSLEEALQQKTKENKDLMQICDELIGKFGNDKT